VAYGSLLLERRRVLHARIVEALEALAPEREAEQVERLAHHALRGEVWAKAVTCCQQAGARVFDRAAFREAVASFDQALQALAHLPELSDTRVQAIELRLAVDHPLHALGEHGRRRVLLGEAKALARMLDDGVRLGRVLARMAHVLRLTGDLDGAIATGQQALALATEIGESALQMQASYHLGAEEAFALHQLGVVHVHADPPESMQAEAHYQQALALADELGMRPLVAHCDLGLGMLYVKLGRGEPARTALSTAIALYRAMDMTFWLPQAEAALAQVGRSGEPETAQ